MGNENRKLLYIAGTARCGSTLLDRLIGHADGCFAAGEVGLVWERGVAKNEICGCGSEFHSCVFWRPVFETAFGGLGEFVDIEAAPRARAPWDRPGGDPPSSSPAGKLEALYRAIFDVSQSKVVVDSSKTGPYARTLFMLPSLNVYVLHIVRDIRGVLFSTMKRKVRFETAHRREYMNRRGALDTVREWLRTNLQCEALRYYNCQYMRIRYEDLVANPKISLKKISRFIHEDIDGVQFVDNHAVILPPSHISSGNPMRFTTGRIDILLDNEWRDGLSSSDRYLANVLAWPLMARYGYLGKTR